MAVRPTVTDTETLGKELVAASPDLLGATVKAFAESLMSAEVDGICGADYGEVTPERVNRRNGYRTREWDTCAGACQLTGVEVTYHGAFAYVVGVLPGGEQVRLCRLRYGGSAHSLGFTIYSAAHDRYQEAALLSGFTAGSPQDALDTACTVHLASTDQ